jgi:hypothetical protein
MTYISSLSFSFAVPSLSQAFPGMLQGIPESEDLGIRGSTGDFEYFIFW